MYKVQDKKTKGKNKRLWRAKRKIEKKIDN